MNEVKRLQQENELFIAAHKGISERVFDLEDAKKQLEELLCEAPGVAIKGALYSAAYTVSGEWFTQYEDWSAKKDKLLEGKEE